MTESHLYFTPEEQKDCQYDMLIFVGQYIAPSNGRELNACEATGAIKQEDKNIPRPDLHCKFLLYQKK